MAAIEGFELSIATGDAAVAPGMIDGTAIAGDTLDANGLADGNYDVVYTGSALELDAAADQVAGDTILGQVTVASNLVTAVSLAGRGRDLPASA